MMVEPSLVDDLVQSLRRSMRLALLPVLIGTILAALWLWFDPQIGIWPLGIFAAGIALSMALAWLLGFARDQQFLPKLADLRGITASGHSASPQKLLPDEIVPMGTQKVMLNTVSGRVAGRNWQAGFLECSRRDLQTGRTRVVFSGQIVQLQSDMSLPDFVLRPKRPALAHHARLADLGLSKAAEVTGMRQDWVLYTGDPAAGVQLIDCCPAVFAALPDLPKSTRLLGIIGAQGWIQLICANRRDLFGFWQSPLEIGLARKIISRVFNNLSWAEITALALVGFDKNDRRT